jgi:hypothetical protein
MSKWKFATMPCARGIAGHAKVSLRMVRGAEPSGVIFQRVTSVGEEVAQACRSTGIRLHSFDVP